MHQIRAWLSAVAVASSMLFGTAAAQSFDHSVYLDVDANPATGCSVTTPAGTVSGFETRVTATVSGQPPQVTTVTRTECVSGALGTPAAQAAGYPVGQDNGTAGADVVEFATSLVGLGSGGPANFTYVSTSATGADIVSAPGVILPLPRPVLVPIGGALGLLVLVGLMLWLVRRHPGLGSSMALLLLLGAGAGVVWAANFITDGQIPDWTGVSPHATDPATDSTSSEGSIDIVAVFSATEGGRLFLRVDVRNADDETPTANAQAVTLAEEGTLAITLVASDPEGAPLTFAIGTAPARGTLSAITPINATSASVTYTGNLDEVGADSFTFTASDGVSTSAPATVSITITQVNDAPVVAAQTLAVVENSPNGTVVGTATATDVDTGQTLAWSITAGNALGAFAIDPATGQITVTDSADIIPGNSPFALTVQATDNGTPPLSGNNTITITVTGVNDEPTFTPGPNQSVNEDDVAQSLPNWATAISAGPADEAAQTLAFTVSNDNNALFSVQPAVSPTGTLTYTLAPNANGVANVSVFLMDNGGTVGGGDDTSPTSVFTITVAPVNDTPVFTLPANPDQTVLQDSGTTTVPGFATGIDAGAPDESAQGLSFTVANDNNALFSTQPAIAANGTLTFTPASGQVGIANITVTLTDTGGGADTSAAQTFTINISIVNQPPSFTPPTDPVAVLEDAGLQTVPNFVVGIDDGDASVTQAVGFNVTASSNPALLTANPVIAADGTLTYTPAPNANGTTTITFEAQDDGGTTIPGSDDTSDPDTFVITVTAVNDAPSFTVPVAAPASAENAGAQSVATFAGAILAGPPDESGQTLTFTATVTAADPTLTFSAAPVLDAAGNLTYTADANAFGTATVSVTLADSGSNVLPDVNTSAAQSFTITVTPINSPPSFTLAGNPAASNEDAGAQVVNAFATAISAGPNESGQTLSFLFTPTGSTGTLGFAAGPAIDPVSGNLSYTATADTNGTATFDVVLQDNGGGTDTSAPQSFTITVDPVNDAPAFTLPANPDVNVNQDTGAATFAGYATAISRGPADESGQTLTFAVAVTTNPTLFSVAPEIDETTGTLTFTPAPGQVGSADISVTLADSGGGVLPNVDTSAAQTFTIFVDDVNEAPVPSAAPSAVLIAEDAAVATAVSTITPNDPDAGQTHSYAFFSGNTGNMFAIDASGNITVAGALDFEALGSYTLVVRVTDDGTPALSGDVTVTVTITDVNEAPVVAASGTLAYTEGDGAVTLNTGVTVGDPDAGEGLASATVQITGNYANGQDILAMAPSGGITASFAPAGGLLTLSGAGTPAQYQTALRSVTFENTSNAPSTAQRTLSWTVNDGALASNVATTTIDVTTINSAPVLTTSGGSAGFTEGGAAVAIDAALTATDADSTNATGATVSITGGFQNGEDTLAFATLGAISGIYDTGTGVLTLSGSDTFANYQAALRTVTYANGSNTPDTADRTISFVVFDDAALASNTATRTLTVTASNDAPVNTVPAAQQVVAGGTLPLSGANAISIVDLDAGTGNVLVTVSTSAGGFSATASGAAVVGGTAVALTITGTVTDVNATLQTLVFTAPAATTTANVTVLTDDQGNSGGAAQTDSDGFPIAVDQAPTITGTTPADAATDVVTTANLVVTFSEAVTVDTSDFAIVCNSATQTFTLAGSGTATATLTPSPALAAGSPCTLTITGSGIVDADTVDPTGAVFVAETRVVNFSTRAVANDDSFAATPHLTLAINAATGVTANDDLGIATITGVGAGANCAVTTPGNAVTTEDGGRTVLLADGSLEYYPPAGDTGTADAFCYTVTGGDTAVVTLNLAPTELVWFVDATPTAGAPCVATINGTQGCPEATLAAVTAVGVDTASDTIFVAEGSYTCAITLETSERLIGDGSSSNLAAITGITPVAGSAFPVFSGTDPVLTSASTCIMTSTGNAIRGLTIANSTTADIAGSAFGTLTISETSLNGTGQTLNLINGTLAASFDALTSTGSPAQGLNLNQVGGSLTASNGTAISGSTTQGILVTAASGAATFNFGNTTVSAATDGVSLQNSAASAFTFGTLAITAANGTGLLATTVGSIDTSVSNAGTITATNGPAINATSVDFGATFAAATSTNSPARGISLDAVTGTLTINGGSITGATGVSFFGNGTLGTVSYAGSITKNNTGNIVEFTGGFATTDTGSVTLSGTLSCSGCSGIDVVNRDTGTITFSGSMKTLNTAGSASVNLDNNDTATINFDGGNLDIDTTTGIGFNAVNGASAINVIGSNNTIVSTSAAALSVIASNIGASDLTFTSVSSGNNTAAADPANGIVLNATGGTGELIISGTGAAGTGGTIQNTTGHAILLNATRAPSFTSMLVDNTQADGINATALTNGFTVSGTTLSNIGNSDNENGITLVNVGGTVSIQGTTISNVVEEMIEVDNNNTNLTLNIGTVAACSFIQPNNIAAIRAGGAFAGNGVVLTVRGSSSNTIDIRNSTFTDIKLTGFQLGGDGTSAGTNNNVTLDNNDFLVTIVNALGNPNNRANTINIQGRTTIDVDSNLLNNLLDNGGGGGLQVGADESSNVHSTLNSNTVSDQFADGVLMGVDENAHITTAITNNQISNTSSDGMELSNGIDPGLTSTLNAVITDNTVINHNNNLGSNSFFGGIAVFGAADAPDVTHVNIDGNVVSGNPNPGVFFDYVLDSFGDQVVHQGPGVAPLTEADFLSAPAPSNTSASPVGGRTFLNNTIYSNGTNTPNPVFTP